MVKNNFELRLLRKLMRLREITKVNGKLGKKFIGALTVEILRKELIRRGFNVSNRDVFIEGSPNEFDLLILKKGERAKANLLYTPKQVVAAFEIKFSGAFPGDPEKINSNFQSVKKINKKIRCVYLAISEDVKYKYYPEEKKLGDFSCFLLARNMELEKAISRSELKITGDWDKLVGLLNKWKK